MNLNPFVFSYKYYPKSNLATMTNKFCSAMQRIFLVFAIIIILVVIFEDVSNSGAALCGAAVLFALWLILKLFKDRWSDKIAVKQETIDNDNTEE